MTEPAPDPRLRARRVALVVLAWAFFGILGGLSVAAREVEAVFQQLSMTMLPPPTEGFLALARFVGSPLGFAVFTLAALGASAVILRGGADRRLKPLTIAAVVATVLVNGLFALSIYLPILKIQQHLSR